MFDLTQTLPGENNFLSGIPWIQVAKLVATRSERQCRKKWMSYYNLKNMNLTRWDIEDDLHLINRLVCLLIVLLGLMAVHIKTY